MSEDLALAAGDAVLRAFQGEDPSQALAQLPPALRLRFSSVLHGRSPAERVFQEALDLPAAERAGFLDRACAGDVGLRREVEGLLRSAEALPQGFLAGGGRSPECVGPYVLERRLGRGGQGSVFLAFDARLQRRVALKLLGSGLPPTDEMLRRFRREAEAAARLQHPGICPVFESGELDGRPYIAMRYVEGTTLLDLLEESRARPDARHPMLRLPAPEGVGERGAHGRHGLLGIVALVERLATALDAAHRAGVLHRDVKPGNVIVAPDGAPVLVDFGLARDRENADSLTRPGDFFGTPSYMAPERVTLHAAPPDERADVYSLGVLLYECVTLRLPFDGDSLDSVVHATLAKEPRNPRRINRAVPADLAIVIATALAKDRDRRYATAAALAEDLRAVSEGRPIRARPISLVGRAWRWIRRQPTRFAASLLLTLGLTSLGGLTGDLIASRSDVLLGRAIALGEEVRAEVDRGFRCLATRDRLAAAHFRRALDLDPRAVLALGGLWFVEPDRERGLGLVESRREDLAADPDYACLHALAMDAVGRSAEAEAVLRGANTSRSALPHLAEALRLEPECLMGNADTADEAVEQLDLAIAKSSRSFALHALRLDAASLTRDGREAAEAARVLTDLWGDRQEAWLEAARALHGIDTEEAQGCFDTGMAMDGDSTLGVLLRADFARWEGRHQEAQVAYAEYLARDPDSEDGLYRSVTTELFLGREDRAAERLAEAEAIHGNGWMFVELLGVCRQRQGDLHGALAAFERGIALGPRLDRFRVRRASMLVSAGRLDEADAQLDQALAIYAGRPWTWTLRARTALARGRREEAVELHRKAGSLVDGYPAGRWASLESWDCAGAREFLELDAELHPDGPEEWHALARFLVDPRMRQVPWDAAAAFRAATRAAELTGRRDAAVLATLAEAHFARGQPGDAAATATSALALATAPALRAALEEALLRYER